MSADDVRETLQAAYRTSHDAIRETFNDIPEEWLAWSPQPGVSTPGFLLWHLLRDEDVVVQVELAGRPQRWEAEGWAKRMDMDTDRQGTGFTAAEVSELGIGLADLHSYAECVWEATADVLSTVADQRLADDVHGWAMVDHLLGGSVGHNWVHLGEVRMLMGLRGWRFRE